MQIDSCGKFSEILGEILDEKLKEMRLAGEKITIYKINTLDMGLFEAYQKILSIAKDGDTITKALQYFGEQAKLGNLDITYMTEIAGNSAMQARKEIEMQARISNGITAASVGVMALASFNMMESCLIDNICTNKMEQMHKETFEKARNGDTNSINVLDLVNRSASYLAMSDKLNPNGRDAGALALISSLVRTQDKQALEMASNLVEHFGLTNVADENGISIEKVEKEFGRRFPNINLSSVSERMATNAIDNKSKVLERSTESFRETVIDKIDRKKIIAFRKQYGKYVEEGNQGLAEKLVKDNPELAEKAFDFWSNIHKKYILGKKPENKKQNAIQNNLEKMLGKKCDIDFER